MNLLCAGIKAIMIAFKIPAMNTLKITSRNILLFIHHLWMAMAMQDGTHVGYEA